MSQLKIYVLQGSKVALPRVPSQYYSNVLGNLAIWAVQYNTAIGPVICTNDQYYTTLAANEMTCKVENIKLWIHMIMIEHTFEVSEYVH